MTSTVKVKVAHNGYPSQTLASIENVPTSVNVSGAIEYELLL